MRKSMFCLLVLFVTLILLTTPVLSAVQRHDASAETLLLSGDPVISVQSYEIVKGSLATDSNVTIAFTFHNNSTNVVAKELMVDFISDSTVVSPAFGTSCQMYVGDVGNQDKTVEKEFYVSESAGDIVVLRMSFSYSSRSYDTAIYLPILQKNGFTAQISLSQTTLVGQDMPVSVIVGNTSNQSMSDLKMNLDGKIRGGAREISLGDLAIGQQHAFAESVLFDEMGDASSLNISFSFADENGGVVTIAPTFWDVNVREAAAPVGTAERQTSLVQRLLARIPSSVALVAGIVCILALVIIPAVLRRRKT